MRKPGQRYAKNLQLYDVEITEECRYGGNIITHRTQAVNQNQAMVQTRIWYNQKRGYEPYVRVELGKVYLIEKK